MQAGINAVLINKKNSNLNSSTDLLRSFVHFGHNVSPHKNVGPPKIQNLIISVLYENNDQYCMLPNHNSLAIGSDGPAPFSSFSLALY